jgi:formate hydrogenlyase subunit 3/multisubunit Na+/H+ antiporter MnhD subunit
MARFLIVFGLVLVAAGLLWPFLGRIGLGRLPGDIVVERDHVSFYFPIVTCLVLSLLLGVAFWVFHR